MRKKIVVRGPVLSQSGYGEQARFAVRSLRAHEDKFDIFIVPVGWGQTGWLSEDNEERRWLDFVIKKTNHFLQNKGTFDISLQVTIPNEWEPLAPVNIGYTAGIESDKITPQWIEKSRIMDKIIVVSNHAKHGFDNTSYEATNKKTNEKTTWKNETPVETVNYAVRNWESTGIDIDLDYDFNFLAVAQWGPRKNMVNTVKWFVEECFDQEVGLVVKTSVRKNNIMDRSETERRINTLLKDYKDRKCKVYLPIRSGKKTKNQPLFSRIPYTIGQIQEFARWEGVIPEDSNWCYPEQQGYKMRLRDMIKKHDKHQKNAKKLQRHVLKEFAHDKQYSKEKQYEKFCNAIMDVLGPTQDNVVKVFG